jgi:fructose-1,6-bisphosphatase I
MIIIMKSLVNTLLIVGLFHAATAFQAPHIPVVGVKSTSKATTLNVATGAPSKIKAPVLDEVCETTGVTLKRYMNEVAMLNPEMTELVTLFGAIETACKAISNLVKRSQLPSSETLGYQGEINIQGEDQKKLDVITNDLLKRALRFTGRLGVLASEEEDVPVSIRTKFPFQFCLL